MTNQPFETTSLNDLTVVSGYESWLRDHGLNSLDALFDFNEGESLTKPGLHAWRERIRLNLPYGEGTKTFYLKRFMNPPPAARREIRRSGCGACSLAGLEWAWLAHLHQDEIPCAAPVAMGEELHETKERRSAILMAEVPGMSLEKWVKRWTVQDLPTIRSLLCPLATLVAKFHHLGYIHRDLYLSHVFYDPAASPDSSLHLIDLQRVKKPVCCRRRQVVKDLAALNFSTPADMVSRSDRIRWLKFYLQTTKLNADARRLAYRIVGKTQQMARHERRRQLRLTRGE